MNIGERIKFIRASLRQDDFASKLGLHKNTIGKWERSKSVPDANNLLTILEAYPDINPTWLVTGKGDAYGVEPTGKRYQVDELRRIVIQAAIQIASESKVLDNKQLSHIAIDIEGLLAECRETLPSLDEVKSIFEAFIVVAYSSSDKNEKASLRLLLKIVAASENANNKD